MRTVLSITYATARARMACCTELNRFIAVDQNANVFEKTSKKHPAETTWYRFSIIWPGVKKKQGFLLRFPGLCRQGPSVKAVCLDVVCQGLRVKPRIIRVELESKNDGKKKKKKGYE